MGMEGPPISPEEDVERDQPPVEIEVEPFSIRGLEQEPPTLEPASENQPAEKELSKVIEGPWPKPEMPEPPNEIPGEMEQMQPTPEEAERLASLQQELDALDRKLQEETNPKTDNPSDEEDQEGEEKLYPYTSVFEQYQRCEACGGKGRRWLFLTCPVCKGLGSVLKSSSTTRGYYGNKKE